MIETVSGVYRPKKVTKLKEKRGYQILHRYKSYHAGIFLFTQDIYLVYDNKKGVEYLHIDIGGGLPIKAAHKHTRGIGELDSVFSGDGNNNESELLISGMARGAKIDHLRKLHKPEKIFTNRKCLRFGMEIVSSKGLVKEDILIVAMCLEYDGKQRETLLLETICNTPVKIGRIFDETEADCL